MLLPTLATLAGFALLIWSSDKFVDGASGIAQHLGVSPLIIGLTIVGFGTSAPEMLISGIAAWQGNPHLAVGNAIGSNIANIALILGTTALVIPLAMHSRLLKMELPILLGATLFTLLLLLDGNLNRLDGVLLVATLLGVMTWLVRDALTTRKKDALATEFEHELGEKSKGEKLNKSILLFIIGLVVLLLSARLLVWGAVEIATAFGISDLVIGLTIVAIGTSLPELAASIASVRKDESDIAIGNVIGSNLFNMLAVLAIPGLIRPGALPDDVISRDFPVMLALTIALFFLAFRFRSVEPRIGRVAGALLLAAFIGYEIMLFVSTTGNPGA